MRAPWRGRGFRLALACALSLTAPAAQAAAPADWLVVDYSELIDRRQLSHSGESVGALLARLAGRPLPEGHERPADRSAHALLEPLVEPYAFVLSDALDERASPRRRWFELGSLWQPGEPQPAWVELLRARRYVIESDGAGILRAILPWAGGAAGPARTRPDSRLAAQQAWSSAWPVLRHVFAAEMRRLAAAGAPPAELWVDVHAYRHFPERAEFQLGTAAETLALSDMRPDGRRPALDLEGLHTFLARSLRLEGGRLEPDGGLRLLGSPAGSPPAIGGGPLALSDFAVAYRAVFHGGLAEPYMSLDRGYSPARSLVNYGGRLRDTALGRVSLQCDMRFKTFSLGLDIAEGQDLRERLRQSLPQFRTHLERLAASAESEGLAGQQTRLWFYPDEVDLTLSEQGDLLVLRRVRMSAAAERLGETGMAAAGQTVRPWTRATVEAINADYDALARVFSEMADLDQVVRLLALFAWLEQAESEGQTVPDLAALLAVELPAVTTPRTYPQLLAFNALPPPGDASGVTVFDRVAVGEALERLNPTNGRPLPARRRYQRAVGALDPDRPEHARLLGELRGYDLATLDDSALDLLAQRAERVRMHETVLATLDMPRRRELGQRLQQGEKLRMFSVGIGGLDLGLGPVVARATGRRAGLSEGGAGLAEPSGRPPESDAALPGPPAAQPRESWRVDREDLPAGVIPEHGPPAAGGVRQNRFASGERSAAESAWELTLYGADAPEVRSRRLVLDRPGGIERFERAEDERLIRYRLERQAERVVARALPGGARAPALRREEAGPLPPGLALLRVAQPADGAIESREIALRFESWIDGSRRESASVLPREELQRLVLGHEIDGTPDRSLPGLHPLPPALGEIRTLMVVPAAERWDSPWERTGEPLAGEEDPLRLARALAEWWAPAAPQAPSSVVGVDVEHSPDRWAAAPLPDAEALLLLPEDGFEGTLLIWRSALATGWRGGRVSGSLAGSPLPDLVVLVSADSPARFAARLRELARDDRMRGRLLAAWPLAGPVREDLARSLIGEGRLAGVGIAEVSVVARRRVAETLGALAATLDAPGTRRRVEQLPGPFLWHF